MLAYVILLAITSLGVESAGIGRFGFALVQENERFQIPSEQIKERITTDHSDALVQNNPRYHTVRLEDPEKKVPSDHSAAKIQKTPVFTDAPPGIQPPQPDAMKIIEARHVADIEREDEQFAEDVDLPPQNTEQPRTSAPEEQFISPNTERPVPHFESTDDIALAEEILEEARQKQLLRRKLAEPKNLAGIVEKPQKKLICPFLNPWLDAVGHPDSDPECGHGMPGWRAPVNCRCKYMAKDRNEFGCTLNFFTICQLIDRPHEVHEFSGEPPVDELKKGDSDQFSRRRRN